MSVEGLLQDTVRVWRLIEITEAVGLGAPRREWTIVQEPDAVNAAVQRRGGSVRDPGPGAIADGQWMVYQAASAEVEERDVVETVAGTQPAGILLAVDKVYRPRGHHTEITARRYLGDPPVLPE